MRDLAGEAFGCVGGDDAAAHEGPYFGPDIVVDDCKLCDETEDGGEESKLGFGAAVCLSIRRQCVFCGVVVEDRVPETCRMSLDQSLL